ncbi:MAG: cytidine deaminase [Clostridiales bacterium]|jgi:cytidine deaminase|nr:cytidine deaminase [Clostridiales bacterium]
MIDDNVIRGLCQKAVEMRSESYAPYSDFLVGSAILTADGKIFTGCNIENSAFGPSICAERTAIAKAVSEGYRDFAAIAIAGGKRDGGLQYCAPCGVCRQVMREFCRSDFKIYLAKSADDYQEFTLGGLLPESFGPDNLA